jgi:DHA1 family inner membrane transport protein
VNISTKSFPLPLLALALAAFGIGTAEFIIMGLLPEVAADLRVSIPSAGLLVTGYALGVAIGAPILAIVTSAMPRKLALMGLMGLFILGNVLSALAPGYDWLLAARVVAAFCHGAFFGIGAVVAASLVPANKQAQAIALMFTGLTLANVLGVPAGTALGQAAGWRAAFWAVSAIGVVAFAAVAAFVPAKLPMPKTRLMHEFAVLRQPQVWIALGMTVLGFGGVFTVFTYIAPILEQVTKVSPHAVTGILLLFGAGLTVGNTIGGKLADWKLMPALMGILGGLALVLVAFSWTSRMALPAMITVFVWGVFAFATVPPLQMRVVAKAVQAPNLASTLNIGAFNLGNALGAWLGGVVITQGAPLTALPFAGAAVTLAGLGLTLWSALLDRRPAPRTAAVAVPLCESQ